MLQRDRLTQKSGDYCRDECGQAGTCQRLDHARRHNNLSLGNILETISSMEAEIKRLQRDLPFVPSEEIKKVVNHEIGYMQDNLYRYKLQARAWKLID